MSDQQNIKQITEAIQKKAKGKNKIGRMIGKLLLVLIKAQEEKK